MTTTQQFDNYLLPLWSDDKLRTPAFVYDESHIVEKLELLAIVKKISSCHILYSVKALSFNSLLQTIAKYVDGFSVSSLFESRLARDVLRNNGSIHLTSPGIRTVDMPEISKNCDYISFNSLGQFIRNRQWAKKLNCGLRINPGLTFVKDERYDPCRLYSKLGVPVAELDVIYTDRNLLKEITGLHVHSNSESEHYSELEQTICKLVEQHGELLANMQWLNLGGGYLLNDQNQLDVLCRLVRRLRQQYELEVYFEPGRAVVGNAGYLVTSVIDLFNSNGREIAVVDTTVNHLPEVFEYQYRPVVLQDTIDGKHEYRIAGASCLSGDLFGDYRFDKTLEIGSRIIFANVGAYMLVKANMFNGINMPDIYRLDQAGHLQQVKKYDYKDYRSRL
jgi:carboxynorspermidine decarboxylase